MSWYKIVLTSEEIIIGESNAIMDQLISIAKTVAMPEGFGVFAGKQVKKRTPYYFTPISIPYVSDILSQYHGTPCEKPSENDIEALLFGHKSTAWELLES